MKKSCVKLFLKFIILGIPLYAFMLYTLLYPMNYMPIEYSMWREEKDYVESSANAKTLIIGDSRAKSGIQPLLLEDENTYNMAIGGSTPIEMYYALEEYLSHNEAPERAIIIFAQYHLCDIDNWGQTQTYNYLSGDELLEVYLTALKNNETKLLGDHFFTDTLSYKLRFPNKYLSSIYNARFNGRYTENKNKYDSVRADRGYTVFGEDEGNDGVSYETHHPEFDSSKTVLLYYDKLLNLCKDNGISVIIEQAPLNETSTAQVSEDFLSGYEQFLQEIEQKYPEFTVVHEIPEYENMYFGDNNHLNKRGSAVFTQYIRDKYY